MGTETGLDRRVGQTNSGGRAIRMAEGRVPMAFAWVARMLRCALLSLVLLGFGVPAAARDLSFDHYIHTKLEAKDGLSVQANSIVQTPDGYLWFGTPDGLFRYNGQSFERVAVERKGSFTDVAIIEALVTRKGEMWLGVGQSGGVAVLRNGIIQQTSMPHPPPQITHLTEGAGGTVWAASSGKEKRLFRHDAKGWQQVDIALAMPTGAVADMESDSRGTIWVSLAGSGGGKLAYLRAGSNRFEEAPDRIGLGRLAVDPKGGLWISDNFGTRMLRDASGRPPLRAIAYPPTPGIYFPRIRFDRNGNIWGSALSGGMFLIPDAGNVGNAGKQPQTFGHDDRIGTVATLDVFPDREGNIWISSSESLHRFHPANAVPVSSIASNPDGPQRLAAATDGSVYLFSLGRLYRMRSNDQPRLVASDLQTNVALCSARSGGVWLMQGNQTILFDDRGRRTLPARSSGSDAPILCEEDGRGRLWSLSRGSVSWFRDGGWHSGFPGLDPVDIWDVATDTSGALVLSVAANRLVRVGETNVTRLETGWSGTVASLRHTRLGLLVSHSNGLWRAPTGGQAAANIAARSLGKRRDFDVDAESLWAFGMTGVERIPVRAIEQSWRKGGAPASAMIFDWSEGLPVGKQETGFRGRQIVAGGDGRIWVLTRAGPYVIDSRNIVRNTIAPPIAVRALWADEHSHSGTEAGLELKGGTRSVRIAYSALSYSMPDRVQFKYRLIGADDEWIPAGNRHEVTFGNLGPGDYRFEVMGANEDGVWNAKPASIDFTVAPTFFQSTGFKVGAALLLFAAIGFAYRWRMHTLTTRVRNAVSERSAERDRIARELHDTLLQSVQALILRFQLLVDHLPEKHPSQNELTTTLNQADEVLAESRKRVLDLRARHPRSDLKSVIAALAKRQLPGLRTDIVTSGEVVPIESTVFNGLIDVANECLFNILRHSKASEVIVEIRYERAYLEMEIADNGVGLDSDCISKAITKGHFGVVGMRERTANFGGKYLLESTPGNGVTVTVQIPSTIAYRTKNPQSPPKGGGWLWFTRRVHEPVGL